jgi:uncharacterized iron-regulated protein
MRAIRQLSAAAVLALWALQPASAIACTVVKADAYAAFWRGPDAPKPRHPLWGQVLFDGQLLRPDTQACETSPLQVMGRDLAEAAKEGGIILLGETHDNGEHHKVRGELIRQISKAAMAEGDVKAVPLVFEHIRTEQQAGLDQFTKFSTDARRLGTPDELFKFLDWSKSGWPDQKLFAPLFDAAILTKSPIVAGDPSKAAIRGVAMTGLKSLDQDTLKTLRLSAPLAAPLQQALLQELEESHCGLVPKEKLTSMVDAQRYHDAHLAAAALAAAADYGTAVVLTGNGHVRSDRGVPLYLAQMVPDKKVVTVLFVETEDGRIDPNTYAPKSPSGKPAADYVVFTPRAARKDPCDEMRAQMQKKG